jgi:5'-3' exonuclease
MIEGGATHLGVATDHVIESFRNQLWPGYKTGEGIEPALYSQFHPLEEALTTLGVTVWAMVETEADDALASAARIAAEDRRVQQVTIWTPDKDLSQCVSGDRVVQVDRKTHAIRNEHGVREKFGVEPRFIPDFLALVGDAADGYPGLEGIGKTTAARLIQKYGALETFPAEVLGERLELALRFKVLATLKADLPLFRSIDELRWQGPRAGLSALATRTGDARLLARTAKLAERL